MISYQDFRRLWGGALDCATLDEFIAEEGGSVALDGASAVIRLLTGIYGLAHGDAKALRAASGLTQADMCREYGIPASTINKWDSLLSSPPPWAYAMIAYAILSDQEAE